MQYWVYIVRCIDNSLYCGITTDLIRRIDEHNGTGTTRDNGARYTASRRPVALQYSVPFGSRSEASIEEYRIKQLTKQQKERLITQFMESKVSDIL